MTNRRTSLYSLRVFTPEPRIVLKRLAAALDRPVTDQHVATEDGVGYAAIGFRASDDTDALRVADVLLMRTALGAHPATLITGHGVHRRTVER